MGHVAVPVAGPAVRTAASATVRGGDPAQRAQVVRLLGTDGFRIQAEPERDALIALIARHRVNDHLGEVRTLAQAYPGCGILVVLPEGVRNAIVRRVLLAGAAGVVLEDDLERALVPAARAVVAGQLTVPRALGRQIAPRPLSHREKQILSLVVLGMTNREIAARLFLAESTVKTHLASAFRKIDARSRSEAIARVQDPEFGYGLGTWRAPGSVAGEPGAMALTVTSSERASRRNRLGPSVDESSQEACVADR